MDKIYAEILEDGTLSIRTDDVSDANHMSADELLSELESIIGGNVTKEKLPHKHHNAMVHKKVYVKG